MSTYTQTFGVKGGEPIIPTEENQIPVAIVDETQKNRTLPSQLRQKKDKSWVYKDSKGIDRPVWIKEDKINNKVTYYADMRGVNLPEIVSLVKSVEQTPIEKTDNKPKTTYRLPKEYLDAYMRMAQGEEGKIKLKPGMAYGNSPEALGANAIGSLLAGTSEGFLNQLNKGITADIGKRQGLKMAKDLGQAQKGKPNLFLNDQGELSGGDNSVSDYDAYNRQKLLMEIELELERKRNDIRYDMWKKQFDAMQAGGGGGDPITLLNQIQSSSTTPTTQK